jgi:choline-sulfatase
MKDISACGFDLLTSNERELLADECVKYLQKPHDRPFFLMASFINPHDICYMAIRDYVRKLAEEGAPDSSHWRTPAELDAALKIPEGVTDEEFYAKYCPPLPPNFEVPPEEPDAITYLVTERPFRLNARENWSEQRWRLHRWAYCRLTELVDAQIGRVLSALDEAGLRENTLVIFFTDHGDHDSAHRLEHKTTFYQEASNIPFLVRAPGMANPGAVDQHHLVSSGLDILPTVCDYAGVKAPAGLQGRSLRPLLEGKSAADWRKTLYLESEIGYMVTDGRYKYCAFDADKGSRRDSLVDLDYDPGEMRNLVAFEREQGNLARLRASLSEHQRENGVKFEMPY